MKRHEEFAFKIASILAHQGSVNPQDIDALYTTFKDSSYQQFENFLLEEGITDKTELLQALSTYYMLPGFDVEGYFFDHQLLRKFPEDFLKRNTIIPLEVDENMIIMVAAEPDRIELPAMVNNFVSYDVQFCVGLTRDIIDAIEEFYDTSLTEVSAEDNDIYKDIELEKDEEEIEEGTAGIFSIDDVSDDERL